MLHVLLMAALLSRMAAAPMLDVLGVVVAARAERHGPSVFTGVRCGCGARWLLHLLVSHVRIDHR